MPGDESDSYPPRVPRRSEPLRRDYNSGSFGCVVEHNLSQGVICFLRNGAAFFGFRSAGSEHRTVVHADSYIELLQELRQDPIPEPVEIMRFRGEGRCDEKPS